jgi:hypothetical protein
MLNLGKIESAGVGGERRVRVDHTRNSPLQEVNLSLTFRLLSALKADHKIRHRLRLFD